ncbi:CPBP family intramembrane glutamic endopeptidase [Nocardiopsis salina]|uniref:CPBP family intramembrane glutamic endopeptidase n=1 Tax=Nocardiopsis salina TaxID=245836 RepID=UPI0003493F10|nr:CPBP family intramembrane glutamic endopeptidase [Nocardiopsis salina]
MTTVRRWGLPAWTALAIALVALTVGLHVELRAHVFGDGLPFYLGSWGAMLVGGVLIWALARALGDRRELDARVVRAFVGHPLRIEVVCLLALLAGFLLSMIALTWLFNVFETEVGADLAMSVSLVCRVLFLFTLPVLILDRSGVTIDGRGAQMPSIALKVREPWRWNGLMPVLVSLALMAVLFLPHTGYPGASMALLGFLCAFAVISLCEEVFFRAMLQTRLEYYMGRWGGIVATSVVFAVTYALVQSFDAVSQLPGDDLVHDTGLAMLTYAAAGLFYGYLWACFRNLWLNVLMRIGVFMVLIPPDLTFGIVEVL